jgi:hypothetical protein
MHRLSEWMIEIQCPGKLNHNWRCRHEFCSLSHGLNCMKIIIVHPLFEAKAGNTSASDCALYQKIFRT